MFGLSSLYAFSTECFPAVDLGVGPVSLVAFSVAWDAWAGAHLVALGHPYVGLLFVLHLIGFVECGALATVTLLQLLCILAQYFQSSCRLVLATMGFGGGVILWVVGRLGFCCLLFLFLAI